MKRRTARTRVDARTGRLLLDCVSGAAPIDLTPDDLPALVPLAWQHRVSGFVWRAIRSLDVPVPAQLQRDAEESVGRHLRVRHVLRVVAAAFGTAGIPWLTVKGPVLSEAIYEAKGLRWYSDLDVLVPPSMLAQATDALLDEGYVLLDQNHGLLAELMPGELHLRGPNGVMVDLHWTLINAERNRQAFPVDTASLVARRSFVELAGAKVPTTDPADTLVHVALHAALAGAHRLIWLKDVDQVVRNLAPSAQLVIERARSWQAGYACALVLARAQRALGTPVPHGLLATLAPSGTWRRAMDFVQRQRPVERCVTERSILRMTARAARADARASTVELLRRMRAAGGAGDAASLPPDSLLTSHPDEAALRRFFDEVATFPG